MTSVVNFARVTKFTRSVVSTSPSLRAKLYSTPFGFGPTAGTTNVISIVPRQIMKINKYGEIGLCVPHDRGRKSGIPAGCQGGWWTLQISQPPVQEVKGVECCCWGEYVVQNSQGVTLGDLYDAVEARVEHHEHCQTCMMEGGLQAVFGPEIEGL